MTRKAASPSKSPAPPASKPKEYVNLTRARPSSTLEERVDETFLSCFTSPSGVEVLKILRAQFINTILGPTSTDQELRHREGARYVVAYIGERIGRAERDRGSKE